MLRSIAELAAYGTLAVLLTAASLAPEAGTTASSAATSTSASSERALTTTSDRAVLPSSRGALLFATKGCIGCHMHASFPKARMQVGPDLTALVDRAATRVAGLDPRAYVRQTLRDPSAYRVPGYTAVMPDLGLTNEQIESLTAFLLSPAR